LPNPEQVAVLLSQHIGAPCKPLVAKKDKVTAGDKIGDSDAFVCAPVHSPVNGTVKDIALQSHPVLGRAMAVIIDADKESGNIKKPCSGSFNSDFDVGKYPAEQIRDAIRRGGLVGMGGAGFPTRVKIEPNPEQPKDILIINGCECEPFITCDYRVMIEWTYQVIAGIKLARKASECAKVYIGIEDNKPRAVEVMRGERQLIKSICNRDVPVGGIPPMIGICVLNVGTCAAIAEAVVLDRPLTHRVVTVTGEGVANRGNFYVPIGTAISDLIEHCGGLTEDAAKVVSGGPMMGIAIADLSMPITKTSGAITVLTGAKYESRRTSCIRCGRCLEVCPANLNPTRIAHAVKGNLLDIAEQYYMSACMECGCCSYVCPANIELTGYIKTGKILQARDKKMMPK